MPIMPLSCVRNVKNVKVCENGSNIDYLFETSSVLRNATETKISGLTFLLRFGFLKTKTEPKFCFRTSLVTSTQPKETMEKKLKQKTHQVSQKLVQNFTSNFLNRHTN